MAREFESLVILNVSKTTEMARFIDGWFESLVILNVSKTFFGLKTVSDWFESLVILNVSKTSVPFFRVVECLRVLLF